MRKMLGKSVYIEHIKYIEMRTSVKKGRTICPPFLNLQAITLSKS